MIETRCKKCGKVLRDPESVARGIGPKCAGLSGGRRAVMVKVGRLADSSFSLGLSTSVQTTLPLGEIQPDRASKKAASHSPEDRRRLFEACKPFQCG